MADDKKCPRCGSPLPSDAPQGLCPACLMEAGLRTDVPPSEAVTGAPSMSPSPQPSGPFIPPYPEALAPLFPQLEIISLLGQGGMGAVYKARQPRLDRFVAVKILPPHPTHAAAFSHRFTREAHALARLSHPHIVAVHDFGEAGGFFYFVMEFVDGLNLRQLMRSGELKPDGAMKIVPQVCEALQYAHDEGIVHRDIKPENILIDKKGRVKIADFGLAKLLDMPGDAFTLTGTGQSMGTPHYMAPEQFHGAHEVDHRADIYSLGVTFYEMLTGELPLGRFAAPSKRVQIDVRLDEVVLRTLEREPDLRYQHASEVKTEVDAIRSTPRPTEPPQPAVKPLMQQSLREAAHTLFVPENLDKPGTPASAKWRHWIIFVAIMAASFGFSYSGLHLSLVVSDIFLFVYSGFLFGWAWSKRGTRTGLRLRYSAILFLCISLGIPLILFLSDPQPILNSLYKITDSKPGPHDADFIRGFFLVLVFGSLIALINAWRKLRRERAPLVPADASAMLNTRGIELAIAGEPAQNNATLPGPPPVSRSRRFKSILGVVLGVVIVVVAAKFIPHGRTIVYPVWGDTGFVESAEGPVMGDKLIAKLGIPAQQVAVANRIFQDYSRKYDSLERRHTTHTTDEQGHVHIAIEPFVDEMFALATDLHKELGGLVDQRIAPPPPQKGMVHAALPIFRQAGEAAVTTELWKSADGQYHWKQHAGWVGGGESNTSHSGGGPDGFPPKYRIYWIEPATR
jgi:serine/threonine protein kinase